MYKSQIISSIVNPDWLKDLIQSYYPLSVASCAFFLKSQNDTYVLCSSNGQKYIARLSKANDQKNSLEYEIRVLNLLANIQNDVKVPQIVKTKQYLDYIQISFPEGERNLVIFEFLEGHPFCWNNTSAKFYGKKLGSLHTALDNISTNDIKTVRHYNVDTMIVEPLMAIHDFCTTNRTYYYVYEEMNAISKQLNQKLHETKHAEPHGLIHWDHFHNCMQTKNNTLAFFDFDCSGYGSKISDLAMVNWAFIFFNPDWNIQVDGDENNLIKYFLEGYNEINPIINETIHVNINLHIMYRIYWDMGLHAKITKEFSLFSGHFMDSEYFSHRLSILNELAREFL